MAYNNHHKHGTKDWTLIFYPKASSGLRLILYIKHQHHGGFQILAIYVDDCVLVNNSLAWIIDLKTILLVEFDIIDKYPIHYCLGNQIIPNQHEGWIFLYQT
jgi:hypothetical protein